MQRFTAKRIEYIKAWCSVGVKIENIPTAIYPADSNLRKPYSAKFGEFSNRYICKITDKDGELTLYLDDQSVEHSWNRLERPLLEYVWNHIHKLS